MPCHVKVCGITTEEDALACVELGVRAIGLNFVEGSPRRIDEARALGISRAVQRSRRARGTHVDLVGVVADMPETAMRALMEDVELDCLQLHGDESPSDLAGLLPRAYKAVRIGDADDVTRAASFPGDYLLVDAKVAGALGGTGASFDWALVTELAKIRKLTLAGGLTPQNVAEAVRAVRPFCVDVASGVEIAPGTKDLAKVAAFLAAVRTA